MGESASNNMVTYKCFRCEKKIVDKNLESRFICPHCGSKIFYKPRTKVKTVKAV
jgi:DNA-directed RNA polymerase subunit RPC12/RpoP